MEGLNNQFSQTNLNSCKAKGCKKNHAQHYCKHCENPDSDHRASKCLNSNQPQGSNCQVGQSNKCKVQGCSEIHTAHYCKKCENTDSDHFSSKCSNVNSLNKQNQSNNGNFNQFKNQSQGNNNPPNFSNYPSNNFKKSNTANSTPTNIGNNNNSNNYSSFNDLAQAQQGNNQMNNGFTPNIQQSNNGNNKKFNVYKNVPNINYNNPFTNQVSPNPIYSNQMNAMQTLKNNQISNKNQMKPFQIANPAQIYSNNPMNNNNQMYKCKVALCSLPHPNHFCRWCNNPDSDHLASQCPYYDPSLKCKVPNCSEKHQLHYCKNCKDHDSDHFSTFCPFKLQPPMNQSPAFQNFQKPGQVAPGGKCNVAGCKRQHNDHYCRFCENKNSNHFAKDCPHTVELCHATKLQNVEQQKGIGKIGLQPGSANCRFGQGIYFAEYKFAKEIMEGLHQKEGVLLKCKVYLGKTMDYGNNTDPNGNWKQSYDSCKAIHPPWFGGVTSQGFTEYCIKNPKKCKVYSLTYKGREFRFCDYQKKNEILNELKKI